MSAVSGAAVLVVCLGWHAIASVNPRLAQQAMLLTVGAVGVSLLWGLAHLLRSRPWTRASLRPLAVSAGSAALLVLLPLCNAAERLDLLVLGAQRTEVVRALLEQEAGRAAEPRAVGGAPDPPDARAAPTGAPRFFALPRDRAHLSRTRLVPSPYEALAADGRVAIFGQPGGGTSIAFALSWNIDPLDLMQPPLWEALVYTSTGALPMPPEDPHIGGFTSTPRLLAGQWYFVRGYGVWY